MLLGQGSERRSVADRWHLFCTIRSQIRSHQIEYLSFADFEGANDARRHVLTLTSGYVAAPQVFYFAPHGKWYLIYQVADPSRKPSLQPAYSTSRDLRDPRSWTSPTLLFAKHPDNIVRWIDFWVICDAARAHLFFTSLDGKMWRAETSLSSFPGGWSRPAIVLQEDIFEASHVYRLQGRDEYVALVEAQDESGGWLTGLLRAIGVDSRVWRYYKAYVADRLDGSWRPLAASFDRPFAGPTNLIHPDPRWTDSISHGELIRAGYDERLEVDPAALRFLFQGVRESTRRGMPYGEIPWRLGMLEAS